MRIVFGKGAFYGPISGADEILTANATQLQQAGHEVSVLLLYPHALSDQYYLRLRDAGVKVSSIASPGVHNSLDVSRKLARRFLEVFPASQAILRRRAQKIATGIAFRYQDQCREYFQKSRADLVHVITPDPGAMVIIRAAHDAGIPVLYQEVGTPYHPPGFESHYEQFTSVLPLCAEVAALSPQLARECREKLPAANVSVLPILMDESFDKAATTVRRHSSNGNVTFGFAARLEHLKGPLVLMDAFAGMHKRFAGVKLQITGSGSLKQKLFARARAHGVSGLCEFPGVYTRIEEKSRFMQSLDVFVLPSLTEGTPNGIIEAMACGLPVISTTVGGVPDLVSDETGILVPPGDVEALSHAMSRLAEDSRLRERMGQAGRKRYEKLFNPELVLPLMIATYRRVAPGNGNHSASVGSNGNGLLHPWAHLNL
jgi:glycosyltransferase involved in cell wall biosynthesis